MSARDLTVLVLHDDSLARANLAVQGNIRHVNIIARLDLRVLDKRRPNVAFRRNSCLIRARNSAADVNVATSDDRAVDAAFNFNVARRYHAEAVVDIAVDLDRAVKFNVARRYADRALELKARVYADSAALVDDLPVARRNQPLSDDFGIFAFGHWTRATVLRGNNFAQNVHARRAFSLRNSYGKRLIFLGKHEQIQVLVVNFVVFVDDGATAHAQIKFAVNVSVLAVDGHKTFRRRERTQTATADLDSLRVNAVNDARRVQCRHYHIDRRLLRALLSVVTNRRLHAVTA